MKLSKKQRIKRLVDLLDQADRLLSVCQFDQPEDLVVIAQIEATLMEEKT